MVMFVPHNLCPFEDSMAKLRVTPLWTSVLPKHIRMTQFSREYGYCECDAALHRDNHLNAIGTKVIYFGVTIFVSCNSHSLNT